MGDVMNDGWPPPSVWVVWNFGRGDDSQMIASVWTTRDAAEAEVERRGGDRSRYQADEIYLNDPNGWEAGDPRDREIHRRRATDRRYNESET